MITHAVCEPKLKLWMVIGCLLNSRLENNDTKSGSQVLLVLQNDRKCNELQFLEEKNRDEKQTIESPHPTLRNERIAFTASMLEKKQT